VKHLAFFTFGLLGLVPLACKDTDPCDPGQEIKSTGCFPITATGGGAGTSGHTGAEAGAPDQAAGAGGASSGEPMVEPWGNPNATWGSPCTHNAECGPDAPICATDPFNYCSQIDCQDGEAHAGVCPPTWNCFKYLDYPAICIDPNHN